MSEGLLVEPLECENCGEESVLETRAQTVSPSQGMQSYEWACAGCGAIYRERDRELELLDVISSWTVDNPDDLDRS